MTSILAIAFNTFREAIRNRVLYIILMFALIMIGISGVVSELTIADRERIIKNLGFAAINLFGVAIAVFVGVSLVYNELEKKTIYTIVSKPIDRWQFLLGKFLGLLITIYVNILVMSYFFLVMIHYDAATQVEEATFLGSFGGAIGKALINLVRWNSFESTARIMPVIMATLIELFIMTSFAILYSSFTTPTLSMMFTVLTFIAGRLNEDIVLFAENVAKEAQKTGADPGLIYYVARAAAHITPNLQVFHRTVEQALYENKIVIWWYSALYAVVYAAAVLALATLIFSRRNFK